MAQQIKIPEKLFNELAEIAKNPEKYKEDNVEYKNLDEYACKRRYCFCNNCGAMIPYGELKNKHNFICPECKARTTYSIIL